MAKIIEQKIEERIIESCSECPNISTQISSHFCFHEEMDSNNEIPYEIVWSGVKENCPLTDKQ